MENFNLWISPPDSKVQRNPKKKASNRTIQDQNINLLGHVRGTPCAYLISILEGTHGSCEGNTANFTLIDTTLNIISREITISYVTPSGLQHSR